MVRDAVGIAESYTVGELRERVNRNVWPTLQQSAYKLAKSIDEHARRAGRRCIFWRGGWYQYTGSHYRQLEETELHQQLYELLEDAYYVNKDGVHVPWNPTSSKIKSLTDTMRAQALQNKSAEPGWLDGRKDRVIPCSNGLLRLNDRILLEHTPDYFGLYCLPFAYDARARAPRFEQFLEEAWPNDPDSQALLLEFFGYVVSGRTDLQKMLMLIGVTRSGKGTLTKVLEHLIGEENCAAVDSEMLTSKNGTFDLVDKPLGVFSDEHMLARGKNVVERIKQIVGEDAVRIEGKYRDGYTGRLPTRLMFCSNQTPTLPDASSAIIARLLVLEMKVSWFGREDTNLINDLLLELPGIFNLALEAYERLDAREDHRFTQPASSKSIMTQLRAASNPMAEFVKEHCVFGSLKEVSVAKEELLAAFNDWAERNGHKPWSTPTLTSNLKAAFPSKVALGQKGPRGRQKPAFRGIELKPNGSDNGWRLKQ